MTVQPMSLSVMSATHLRGGAETRRMILTTGKRGLYGFY